MRRSSGGVDGGGVEANGLGTRLIGRLARFCRAMTHSAPSGPYKHFYRVFWHNGREVADGAGSARRLTRNAAKDDAFLDLDQSARVDSLLIDGLAALGERRGPGARDREKALCALDFRLRIDRKGALFALRPGVCLGP